MLLWPAWKKFSYSPAIWHASCLKSWLVSENGVEYTYEIPSEIARHTLRLFSLGIFESFGWLRDTTMGSFLLFTAALVSQYFLTAHASFLPRFLHSGPSPTNNVEPRQAPGVIAASEFLRRGYQACECGMQSLGAMLIVLRSGRCGGLGLYRRRGILVHEQWKAAVPIRCARSAVTGWNELTFDGLASTLLSIDLSHNWTNSTVAFQSTTKPDGAPNLNGPSLWYHESENLIYSGFAGWNSSFGNDLGLPPLSLRTFRPDGTGSGAWNEIIDAGSSVWSQLTRPGQPLMGFGASNAWVLGGFASEGVGPDSPENLIPGMTQFDMTSRSFDNSSVKCCNATGSIYKGALQHVPPFGPTGMFIAMGGRNGMTNNGGDAGLIDFGTVSVFDPTTQQWWNQTTTGSKPSPRVEFCTAGINSTSGTYEMLDDLYLRDSAYLMLNVRQFCVCGLGYQSRPSGRSVRHNKYSYPAGIPLDQRSVQPREPSSRTLLQRSWGEPDPYHRRRWLECARRHRQYSRHYWKHLRQLSGPVCAGLSNIRYDDSGVLGPIHRWSSAIRAVRGGETVLLAIQWVSRNHM